MLEVQWAFWVENCQLALVWLALGVLLPCGDFLDECLFVGNPAVEALGREDAEFGLCQIKPAALQRVPFEALNQPPGFGGGKGFVE